MRRIKAVVVLGLVVLGQSFSSFFVGAEPTPHQSHLITEVPKINGVGLGSFLDVVLTSMGAPVREIAQPRDDLFGMGDQKIVEYPGVRFWFCRPEQGMQFRVWRLEVANPGFRFSTGLRVGLQAKNVKDLLGPPSSITEDIDAGTSTLHYQFRKFDGWLRVDLFAGSVVKITVAEDWT